MALFDPGDIHSSEVTDAYALADRLSECASLWNLLGVEGSDDTEKTAAARAMIDVGDIHEPLDGNKFSKEELEERFGYVRIAPVDEEAMQALLGESLSECPVEGGDMEIYIRRQVRDVEIKAADGRSDVFRFFWDRISAIQHQIIQQTQIESVPRVISVSRTMGPKFNTFQNAAAQGNYGWALLSVEWGERDLAGGGIGG